MASYDTKAADVMKGLLMAQQVDAKLVVKAARDAGCTKEQVTAIKNAMADSVCVTGQDLVNLWLDDMMVKYAIVRLLRTHQQVLEKPVNQHLTRALFNIISKTDVYDISCWVCRNDVMDSVAAGMLEEAAVKGPTTFAELNSVPVEPADELNRVAADESSCK